MTDRLTLTRAFESSGMQSEAAERIATEIYDAIHDNVATKTGIAAVRSDLHEAELRLEGKIAAVRCDLHEVELRLDGKIDRMVARLGALVVIVAGLLFAALQHWPPH